MPISIDVDTIADPDGENADAQQAILEAQGFTVVRVEVFDEDVAEGVVISHTVENFAITTADGDTYSTTVTLTVSRGEEPASAAYAAGRRLRRRIRNRRGSRPGTILQQRIAGFDV